MSKKKQIPEQAEMALRIFCDKFSPVLDEAEATHFYTTEEIIAALKRLTPDASVGPDVVYDYLYPLGYRPTVDTSHIILAYKWMLKVTPQKEKFTNLVENI